MLGTVEFRISSADLGRGVQVVSLTGEIDAHTAPKLDEELAGAIESGAHRLVVDLAGASFVDSSAVRVLVRANDALSRSERGRLVLVSDDPRILRVFELTGLDGRLAIEPSLTEAIGGLANGNEP